MRALLALLLVCAPLSAQWGRDIMPGAGPQLIRFVKPDLTDERAEQLIEALKRFRGPEYKALFLRLLGHDNWQVKHRALTALEYYGDPAVVAKAWPLLTHPHRRMREKAAIACIKLWRGGEPPGDVVALLERERDFFVRRCLEALHARIRGKLKPERVFRSKGDAKFVSGYSGGRPVTRLGKGSAKTLPPAQRWNHPLLGYGEEEVQGASLQPFRNPRQGGKVLHVGQDVGACLDGAGYYAAADGVVKLIHTGSDMGTLIVVEHHLGGRELVCAVYMHGGDTVFVRAGDRVTCGQLLTTMGLSFSAENGGHYAHLHFGLYPGPFLLDHNYGYKKAGAGVTDWRDPAVFLPAWIARTQPLISDLPVLRGLSSVWGREFSEARRRQNASEPGSEAYVDANMIVNELKNVPKRAVARATKLMEGGFPSDAVRRLRDVIARCKGVPGVDLCRDAIKRWESDPLFRKAVKGESRIAATRERAAKAKDRAEADALWKRLLKSYGDTCLAGRIKQNLS